MKQTAGRNGLGDLAPKFAELNDDVLFGEVWSRTDKLSLRDRCIITVVALVSKGITDNSLKYHLTNAKNHGVTKIEMVEIITHIAFYIGWPNAWAVFPMVREVYQDEKVTKEPMFGLGRPNDAKEMFFKGISTPRNKELMRVLSDLKYVEQTGYGVPEVLKHYDKNVFDIEENYINVSIPYDVEVMASMRVSDVGAENGEENGEEKLIALIQKNPKISLFKMAKELNVTSRVVERMIRNCKRIKRVGPDKGGHWEIVDENKQSES